MPTGQDCPDLLNVCLVRPIFSPTDFIQIKGRGTRKHNFLEELLDKQLDNTVPNPKKNKFKLFDFFANCEYFEEKFNYDEILKLPKTLSEGTGGGSGGGGIKREYENIQFDPIHSMVVNDVGVEGMKIDRMFFDNFEEIVKADSEVQKMIQLKDLDGIEKYIIDNIFEKPKEYYNLDKLRKSAKVDRRIQLREIIEKMLGYIPYFKNKEELLEDEFDKFDSRYLPEEVYFSTAKNYFKSYITDSEFREIIENKKYALLNTNANGDVFRKLPTELRTLIPEYIKDNVSLNKFMV